MIEIFFYQFLYTFFTHVFDIFFILVLFGPILDFFLILCHFLTVLWIGLTEDRYVAETLIQEEMAVMLRYDAWKSPTGQPGGGGGLKERELKHFFAEHPYESVPLDALIQAKSLIDEETGVVQEERGRVGEDAVEQTCDLADKRLLFLVSEGRFGSRDEASKRDICDYLEREIDGYDVANKKLNERLVKMDAKLDVVTAGYRRRVQQASKQMEETESQWEQALLDLTSFDHLKRQEDVAVVRRTTVSPFSMRQNMSEITAHFQTRSWKGHHPCAEIMNDLLTHYYLY